MSAILLQYELQSKQSYRLGEHIIIDFKLENLSDHDLWVLSWYTPLEGLKGRIFDATCDGKPVQYEGIMTKRGNPTREDYIHIPSKGSVSATIDLSEAYKMPPECSECKVKFTGRIHDFSDRSEIIPKQNNEHNAIDIPGNVVSFRCVS